MPATKWYKLVLRSVLASLKHSQPEETLSHLSLEIILKVFMFYLKFQLELFL